MKRILLLTTGGTISSVPSSEGLIPSDSSDKIKAILSYSDDFLTVRNIMVMDSSNIQPEEWKIIAKDIYDSMNDFDGIIVTHGTDTMAYTATMMCFMVQNPKVPVVFTGSQLPLSHPLTDAIDNLRTALIMAESGYPGIYIAFDRKIMFGCRAVKVKTSDFGAFESINQRYVAKLTSNGLNIRKELLMNKGKECILKTDIETNVFLLKLTPTTNPDIIDLLISSGIKGIVIEAYGAGGISFIRRDFVSKIAAAVKKNVPVVVTSQCLYEPSNFNIYEVGTKVLKSGAIEAYDMTTESAVCKLMYALGEAKDMDEIRTIFRTKIYMETEIDGTKVKTK